ncbi:hypothetical protein RHMOL_Rhmol02G0076100 [Rhododendron molle]|uniref:Uncharacterized protein n=1 Tax=Rhododendron molle TaxID=49168 RepID=A0ACC0PMB6_RHOML|nr:hypothetical protein RHMOL_Rhmol02G0076100 [Rhododendron molle]
MGSKTIVFLGILLATVLLITSEVTARDLIETSREAKLSNGVEDAKYGGRGHPGGRFGGNRGRGLGGGPGPSSDGGYGEGKSIGSNWDNGGGDWWCCDK